MGAFEDGGGGELDDPPGVGLAGMADQPRQRTRPTDAPLVAPLPDTCIGDVSDLLPKILGLLPVATGDLPRATSVCKSWSQLNTCKDLDEVWRSAYYGRWRVRSCGASPPAGGGASWQAAYSRKMVTARSWSGKYSSDSLYGHQGGVKALQLLPQHNLLATGSLDRTVRLWDLKEGMPVSVSRPTGGTVRAVALDDRALFAGGSDHAVRLWEAPRGGGGGACGSACGSFGRGGGGCVMGEDFDLDRCPPDDLLVAGGGGSACDGAPLFDLSARERELGGHIGPVTSLSLTRAALYSGSWDTSVRVWQRSENWACVSVLRYSDWVLDVAARGSLLLVAAAREVHVHDLQTHRLLHKFEDPHEGAVSCLEAPEHGSMLFTGGADGLVIGHDLRIKAEAGSVVVWHHNAPVNSLAFEAPWLVSGSSDGMVLMTNVEAAAPTRGGAFGGGKQRGGGGGGSAAAGARTFSPGTRRNLPGAGGEPVFAVDIADEYLAAGGRRDQIQIWDFTEAEAAAARAAAAKAARGSRKGARRRGARGGGGGGGAPGGSPPHQPGARVGGPQQQHQAHATRGDDQGAAAGGVARSAPQRVPRPRGGGGGGGAHRGGSPGCFAGSAGASGSASGGSWHHRASPPGPAGGILIPRQPNGHHHQPAPRLGGGNGRQAGVSGSPCFYYDTTAHLGTASAVQPPPAFPAGTPPRGRGDAPRVPPVVIATAAAPRHYPSSAPAAGAGGGGAGGPAAAAGGGGGGRSRMTTLQRAADGGLRRGLGA